MKIRAENREYWAGIGFKVRAEFTLGVGTERRPRLGKGAGTVFRRVAHCLHFKDPGYSHQAGSTHRKPWMACWTPYPCWSGWALERETKSKILSELSLVVLACDPSTRENKESRHIASLKLAWVTHKLLYQKKKKSKLSGTSWCWE